MLSRREVLQLGIASGLASLVWPAGCEAPPIATQAKGVLVNDMHAQLRSHLQPRVFTRGVGEQTVYYRVHASIEGDVPALLAAHAERSVSECLRRLGGKVKPAAPAADLHIVDSPWAYRDRLDQIGLPKFGGAGLFYASEQSHGIVLGTRDVPLHDVLAVVRHECLHHAVYLLFGDRLPTWINEGLAQYFEDGLWIDGRLRLNTHNTERLARIERDFQQGRAASFDDLMAVPHEVWLTGNVTGAVDVRWLYDWSWTYVTAFICGPSKPVQRGFLAYLKAMRDENYSHAQAWEKAMASVSKSDIQQAVAAWLEQEKTLGLPRVINNLAIVGMVLAVMERANMKLPRSLDELRNRGRILDIRVARCLPGPTPEYHRLNDELLLYEADDGSNVELQLEVSDHGLPPTLSAPRIKGAPRIEWLGRGPRIVPWVRVGGC